MSSISIFVFGSLLCFTGMPLAAQKSAGTQQNLQAAQPAPATYQGCISRLPNIERYVLATANRCMLVAGDFKPQQIADRLVVLHGLLLEPSGMTPLTLKVDNTVQVKGVCSATCTLEPPGTRGIHGKEKPGTEGGPPGAVTPPSQP